eukprot:4086184-Prymnesium_polylepis.1
MPPPSTTGPKPFRTRGFKKTKDGATLAAQPQRAARCGPSVPQAASEQEDTRGNRGRGGLAVCRAARENRNAT